MNQILSRPSTANKPTDQHLIVKYDRRFAGDEVNLSHAKRACSIVPGGIINFDAQKCMLSSLNKSYPPSCTELDDSGTWIKKYGLKANKLTLQNILSMLGFKQTQDYLYPLEKKITSKYSNGLFLQSHSKNGVYNITVDHKKLSDYIGRLEEAVEMYRIRLQWLNSDSRRLFGVLTEKSVCIVIDCKQKDSSHFEQFRNSILKLVSDQVSKLNSFNIIRCGVDVESFKDKAVVVTPKAIDEAIDWLNEWKRSFKDLNDCCCKNDTTTCEAVMKALNDNFIESVYFISEGVSSNCTRELLYDKLIKRSMDARIKLNVVSYNCNDHDTISYLRRLAFNAFGPGKFHAYCLLRQLDDYSSGPIDTDPTKNKVIVHKKNFGGAPPGSGVKSDLMIVFEEIQSAKEILDNLYSISNSMKQEASKNNKLQWSPTTPSLRAKKEDEEYMTSKEWLLKHGLNAKKLELFDALGQVCFRHCDGVVDVKKEPYSGRLFYVGDGNRYYQGDAIPREKLVNAKYCDQFAHVLWNDGTIMHVHVTPDLHRNFEQKINIALEQYEKRIDWLSKGSRELFGTVIENNICILIDTSQSMQASIEFVKRKLCKLMNEQLRAKQRFNLVSFNNKIIPWRDRMVEVDEYNMKNALEWIESLNAQGTTNTAGALRFALSDLNTEAIYLLSDGRPDQEPKQILAQINLNTKVPIHTISFNCNDTEANKFLSRLATETNGRYHYFNENGWDADPEGAVPYESEDIGLLKKEIEKGNLFVSQIVALREECAHLSNMERSQSVKKLSHSSKNDLKTKKEINNFDLDKEIEASFRSKYRSKSSFNMSKSPSSFMNNKDSVLNTLHDIQSLEWILPETRYLLEKQFKTQMMKPKTRRNESKSTTETKKKIQHERSRSSAARFNLDSNKIFSQKWIDENNLVTLRLTLLDALNQTSNHNKHSQVLINFIDSNIWNEILEFADLSNLDTSNLKSLSADTSLVVNLDDYEKDLEKQIQTYKKYLSNCIWSVLDFKEKINIGYSKPFEINETNKEKLFLSLENLNWPIKKEEIECIENQIQIAETFLRQSKQLRNYLKYQPYQNKKETSYSDSNEEENNSVRSLSPTQKRLKQNLQNLAEDITETQRSDSQTKSPKLLKQMEKKSDKQLFKGDRVIARNDRAGYFYPGRIIKVKDSRHAEVKFDSINLKKSTLSFRNLIKYTNSTPYLCCGDYVMAFVINEFKEKCYVPGIVQSKLLQTDPKSYPKLYTILYFNGEEGENSRAELIKINRFKYGFIVNFIRSKLGANSKFNDENQNDENYETEKQFKQNESKSKRNKSDENSSEEDSLNHIKKTQQYIDEDDEEYELEKYERKRDSKKNKSKTKDYNDSSDLETDEFHKSKSRKKEKYARENEDSESEQQEKKKNLRKKISNPKITDNLSNEDFNNSKSRKKDEYIEENEEHTIEIHERRKDSQNKKSNTKTNNRIYENSSEPDTEELRNLKINKKNENKFSDNDQDSDSEYKEKKQIKKSKKIQSNNVQNSTDDDASELQNDYSGSQNEIEEEKFQKKPHEPKEYKQSKKNNTKKASRNGDYSNDADPNEIKKDIVEQITKYFDSLKLDEKYQTMYEEFSRLRKQHKEVKSDLGGKLKLLRKDLEEFKVKKEPRIIEMKGFDEKNSKREENILTNRNKETDSDTKTKSKRNKQADKVQTKSPLHFDSNEINSSDQNEEVVNIEKKLAKLRASLPELHVGEEVLARWSDDGWYYLSIIKEKLGQYEYKLEDSSKDTDVILRENILSDLADSNDSFDVDDTVVALHPQYDNSYAPGKIVQISNDMSKFYIRFYDFVESVVLREDVYKLQRFKFQLDIDFINELEKNWIGKIVVARNNHSHLYELGKIINRVGNIGRQYLIEWSNGKQSLQNSNHIFGPDTRKPEIIVNDNVIAPKETIFLPGRVLGKKKDQLKIKFFNKEIDQNINCNDCYWISRDYYDNACNFMKNNNKLGLLENVLADDDEVENYFETIDRSGFE